MLKQFKASSCSLLGVDLGSSSVKILSLSQHGTQFCIDGYGYEQLPPNALETASDLVLSAIRKILLNINSSAKIAAIAVPDSEVLSKTIQLVDNLTPLEIEELIFLEVDKHFGFQPHKLNLDFVIKGPSKSLGMLDILILATNEEFVRKRVDILDKAGLETKIVDIESYALALAETNPFKPFSFAKNINPIEFNNVAPSFQVALGLALRIADDY